MINLKKANMKIKNILFYLFVSIAFFINTYLIFPGVFLLFKFMNCRAASSAPKEGLSFNLLTSLIIFISSYVIIFIFFKILFNFNKKWKIVVLFMLVVLSVIYWNNNIYGNYYGWFENTYTTEMKVYWGPRDASIGTPEAEKAKSFGPLKILTYHDERVDKLKSIFSDIKTDDWIYTTISMHHVSAHWESHPDFVYLFDYQLQRLESIDKRYLTYLFDPKLSGKKIHEIFKYPYEGIYKDFWNYISSDSTQNDSIGRTVLISKIDSLLLNH